MENTSLEWIEAAIKVMEISMDIGADIYPVICGLGLIRMIIQNV